MPRFAQEPAKSDPRMHHPMNCDMTGNISVAQSRTLDVSGNRVVGLVGRIRQNTPPREPDVG